MHRGYYLRKVNKLDQKHPGLRQRLDELLATDPRHQHTIACRISREFGTSMTDREVVGDTSDRGGRGVITMARDEAEAGGANKSDAPSLEDAPRSPHQIHEEIVAWVRKTIYDMFRAARVDPNTPAARVMHILLFSALVNTEKKIDEVEAEKLLTETTRREEAELKLEKLSTERYTAETRRQLAEQQIRKLKAEVKRLTKQTQTIATNLRDRLEDLRQKGNRAREYSRPFDYDRALKQISAVIGIGRPLVPRVEPVEQTGQHQGSEGT